MFVRVGSAHFRDLDAGPFALTGVVGAAVWASPASIFKRFELPGRPP